MDEKKNTDIYLFCSNFLLAFPLYFGGQGPKIFHFQPRYRYSFNLFKVFYVSKLSLFYSVPFWAMNKFNWHKTWMGGTTAMTDASLFCLGCLINWCFLQLTHTFFSFFVYTRLHFKWSIGLKNSNMHSTPNSHSEPGMTRYSKGSNNCREVNLNLTGNINSFEVWAQGKK